MSGLAVLGEDEGDGTGGLAELRQERAVLREERAVLREERAVLREEGETS
jgi:hypothetical protein